jgi:hypothetical protein
MRGTEVWRWLRQVRVGTGTTVDSCRLRQMRVGTRTCRRRYSVNVILVDLGSSWRRILRIVVLSMNPGVGRWVVIRDELCDIAIAICIFYNLAGAWRCECVSRIIGRCSMSW